MNKQFSFTSAGVQQWQEELYNEGSNAVQAERVLIESDFLSWLASRFVLTPEQLSFAQNLGAPTLQIYSVSISNALAEETPIVLEKGENLEIKRNPYEHPKLSQMHYQVKTSKDDSMPESATAEVQQRNLLFSLYYLTDQS